MPRQNRVTPFGDIVATHERGTIMGNRGVIHDVEGRIMRPWRVKRWLLCRLEFKGRHRPIMAPNRWTELFFLDEATGLAAGHRPCCECRRSRFLAFREAWSAGNAIAAKPEAIRVVAIDDQLHAERTCSERAKRTYTASIDELPNGVFITLPGRNQDAYLIRGGGLHAWSSSGYLGRSTRPVGQVVRVLTPRSTVRAIQAGYEPEIHPTASDTPSRAATLESATG